MSGEFRPDQLPGCEPERFSEPLYGFQPDLLFPPGFEQLIKAHADADQFGGLFLCEFMPDAQFAKPRREQRD